MPATKPDKVWSEAIRKQVYEYYETKDGSGNVKKIRYLNVLAAQLVRAAAKGDMQAMKEIGDRLDGKPAQAITADVKVIQEDRTVGDIEREQRIAAILPRPDSGTESIH